VKDEEHFASRFSAEVDAMLEQRGRAEEEGPPSEHAEMLALAEQLAGLDFARGTPLRPRLRGHLTERLEKRRPARRHLRWPGPFPAGQRRAGSALGILLVLLALALLTPAGRSLAQAVEGFIQELRWPNSFARQVEPDYHPEDLAASRERIERELAAGRAWRLSFEGHNLGGCCADGMRNEVVPLSQAMDQAGYQVQLPTVLPEGYTLEEVRLLGRPPYDVFVTYGGPEGRLGLYQAAVGTVSEEEVGQGTVVVEGRVSGVVTGGSLEEVMVGEVPAALVEEEVLAWEKDGTSFTLIGPGLDLETLVQIAGSLAPAR
jgi:hypothetical protein